MPKLERISRGAGATVAAIALSAGLAALPASAQPGGHHHGANFIEHLAAVKAQLNLDASQQSMWDAAVAAGKTARERARAGHDTVRQLIAAEAAKPAKPLGAAPDLAAIATATDKVQHDNITYRLAARDQWLALYSTFNLEQATVVKALLTQRLSRMDSIRERVQQRFGKH